MFHHTCIVCLLTFHCFAGELPKELGKLINLKELQLQRNGFTGTIVCPVLHMQFGHAHNNNVACVCTVTEEEKAALKAKLPKSTYFTI